MHESISTVLSRIYLYDTVITSLLTGRPSTFGDFTFWIRTTPKWPVICVEWEVKPCSLAESGKCTDIDSNISSKRNKIQL